MSGTMQASPYQVPKEPGRWRALALAAGVHAALLAFLWIGVRWTNEVPVAIEAEIWSPQVKEAAPTQPPQPEPKPEPVVKETPKPVEQPVVKPDIALEQEKKRKEQKAREEEERKAEQLKKQELAKKEAADRKRKEQDDQKRIEKERQDTLKRMLAQAGPGGTGEAAQAQGPRGNPEYLARVAAKIKSNTVFVVPDNLAGNPAVEYAVDLLPDGSIRRPIRKLKSSGVPGFDEAVLNAIEKSQPFPPDKATGRVPSGFNIVHRPKDQ